MSSLPSKVIRQSAFDSSIYYILHLWPIIRLALSETWQGSKTSELVEWFAGAISTRFEEVPETDQDDVEDILIQVMFDEFEVNVDDGSEEEVARRIVQCYSMIMVQGDVHVAEEVKREFDSRKAAGTGIRGVMAQKDHDEEETDSGTDDEMAGEMKDQDDVHMADVHTGTTKEKIQPEIDDDGFMTVVGKKKR